MKEAVRLKKVAFEAWLAQGSPEAADRYQQTQRAVALAVVESKSWLWVEFRETIEKDFWLASDVLAKRQLRMRKLGLAQAVFGRGRELVTRN